MSLKGQYVTYVNDTKGFNLFGVLADGGDKVQLQAVKSRAKFPAERSKVEVFWLQKEMRLKKTPKSETMRVEKIKWANDVYYVELIDRADGMNEVELEEIQKNWLIL